MKKFMEYGIGLVLLAIIIPELMNSLGLGYGISESLEKLKILGLLLIGVAIYQEVR